MDAEIKKHLDLRLAKGEISQDEYRSLRSTLEETNMHGIALGERSRAILLQAKKLFKPVEMVVPSDDQPLDVDGRLKLYAQHLECEGVATPYTDIETLAYKANTMSVNLVRTSISTSFVIQCKNRGVISCGNHTMILRSAKAKRIDNAYAFLAQVTFKQRMARYLQDMDTKGHLKFGKVLIYPNGDVQKGDVRINLKQSQKNKAFGVGVKGAYGSRNPDTVIVGETGTSILSKRIMFDLGYDKDVFKALLRWLANAE